MVSRESDMHLLVTIIKLGEREACLENNYGWKVIVGMTFSSLSRLVSNA